MIVTRRRKKPFPWKRVLIVFGALAVVVGVFWWAPSRNWLASQPMVKPLMKPFDVAVQQQTINSQSSQITALQQQLATVQAQVSDRDKQISKLQSQVNDAQAQAVPVTPAANAKPSPQTGGSPMPAGDLSAQGTPDMRRTAQVWAAMDAEAAGKIVQRLPVDYVVRVFALMPPDSVGVILENLPAPYAARLTQEHPELQR